MAKYYLNIMNYVRTHLAVAKIDKAKLFLNELIALNCAIVSFRKLTCSVYSFCRLTLRHVSVIYMWFSSNILQWAIDVVTNVNLFWSLKSSEILWRRLQEWDEALFVNPNFWWLIRILLSSISEYSSHWSCFMIGLLNQVSSVIDRETCGYWVEKQFFQLYIPNWMYGLCSSS